MTTKEEALKAAQGALADAHVALSRAADFDGDGEVEVEDLSKATMAHPLKALACAFVLGAFISASFCFVLL